jgi:hypothetical protein
MAILYFLSAVSKQHAIAAGGRIVICGVLLMPDGAAAIKKA